MKPFSIYGKNLHITFYCWQADILARDFAGRRFSCKACMLAAGKDRLLVELFLDPNGVLVFRAEFFFAAVHFRRAELESTQHLKKARIQKISAAKGKVGHSEPVPVAPEINFRTAACSNRPAGSRSLPSSDLGRLAKPIILMNFAEKLASTYLRMNG